MATLPESLRIYMASDFAVREAAEGVDPDFTEHGVYGIGPDDRVYVIDWWHGQVTADVWIDALLDLVKRHKPLCWFGEAGVIRRAIEPQLNRRCSELGVYFQQEWVAPIADKAVRARACQAWASMGRVIFPETDWAGRVVEQLIAFPAGEHDDAVDALSLLFLVIDNAHPAIVRTQDKKREDRWQTSTGRAPVRAWRVK